MRHCRILICVAMIAAAACGEPPPEAEGEAVAVADSPNAMEELFRAKADIAKGADASATERLLHVWGDSNEDDRLIRYWFFFDFEAIRPLLIRFEPARTSFAKIRDGLAPPKHAFLYSGGKPLSEWICLNGLLGEDDRTLTWFDSVKGKRGWRYLQGQALAQKYLRGLLRRDRRWTDLLLTGPDPLEDLQSSRRAVQIMDRLSMLPKEDSAGALGELVRRLKPDAAGFYVGYIQNHRFETARKFAVAVSALPGGADLLVDMVGLAIQEGVADAKQKEIVELAEEKGADVRELRVTLETSLAEKK